MTWHCGALILHKNSNLPEFRKNLTDHYERIGKVGSLDEVLDEATNMALHESDKWLIVLDPMMFLEVPGEPGHGIWPRWLEVLLLQSEADCFSFIMEGTSATYGYAVYERGNCVRLKLVQDNVLLQNEGGPIDVSDGSVEEEALDEQSVLDAVQAYGFDMLKLKHAKFEVFEVV